MRLWASGGETAGAGAVALVGSGAATGEAVGILTPSVELPPAADRVDTSELTLVQRLLLTTDGTITHILEAFTNERVEIVKLDEAVGVSQPGDAGLDVEEGELLLRRRVLIRGSVTKTPLIYAVSSIAVRRLPPPVHHALVHTDEPIGRVLFAHRTESLREILQVRREPAGDAAACFGVDPEDWALCRTYRILAGGRPIMLIDEKFPETAFQ